MRIAVIGGGLFGITAATRLAERGHDVELYEKNSDIMMAASWVNQWRLHRGYHYPRSPETAMACKSSVEPFRETYGSAIIDDTEHYYAIAAEGSRTTADEYVDHLDRCGLSYERGTPPVLDESRVELSLRVEEARIDPFRLKELCRDRLDALEVTVTLGERVSPPELTGYDYVVVATYANSSTTVDQPALEQPYKFELCEKPVVSLPDAFDGWSAVIMDGPFLSLDPYGRTGDSLMSDVVEERHRTNVGLAPEYDEAYEELLDRGLVRDPPITRFDRFVESAARFFPGVEDAIHVGSMYTFRAVLPDVEGTDARPTVVEEESGVVRIFSGKLVTCATVADRVANLIGG